MLLDKDILTNQEENVTKYYNTVEHNLILEGEKEVIQSENKMIKNENKVLKEENKKLEDNIKENERKAREEIERLSKQVMSLDRIVQEFEAFKKGLIWRNIEKYRKIKRRIKGKKKR